MFSTRTIRTYLKDGLLTGRKIGSQWRFTEDDITKFMNQGGVGNMIRPEHKQDVLDFLDGVFTEYTAEMQTCTIVDVYKPLEMVEEMKDEMAMLPSIISKSEDGCFKRMTYIYNEEEGYARFILFGSFAYIGEAMKILKKWERA